MLRPDAGRVCGGHALFLQALCVSLVHALTWDAAHPVHTDSQALARARKQNKAEKVWSEYVYVPARVRDASGEAVLLGSDAVPLLGEIAELHLGDAGDPMVPEGKTASEYHTTVYIGLSGTCYLQLLSPQPLSLPAGGGQLTYNALRNYEIREGSSYVVFPGVGRQTHVGPGHDCRVLRLQLNLRDFTWTNKAGWMAANLNYTHKADSLKSARHVAIPGDVVKGLHHVDVTRVAPGDKMAERRHEGASEILLSRGEPACSLWVGSQSGQFAVRDIDVGTIAVVNPGTPHSIENRHESPCQVISVLFGNGTYSGQNSD